MQSIAPKFGMAAETLRNWVRQAERDRGLKPGPTSEELVRIKELDHAAGDRGAILTGDRLHVARDEAPSKAPGPLGSKRRVGAAVGERPAAAVPSCPRLACAEDLHGGGVEVDRHRLGEIAVQGTNAALPGPRHRPLGTLQVATTKALRAW